MRASVAEPGFPVGGGQPSSGYVPTSDAGTFRQKRMSKRKNWVRLGGGRREFSYVDPLLSLVSN